MTGQNDLQTQILSGQIVVFAEHCPVTGCYFEPCFMFLFVSVLGLNRPAAFT